MVDFHRRRCQPAAAYLNTIKLELSTCVSDLHFYLLYPQRLPPSVRPGAQQPGETKPAVACHRSLFCIRAPHSPTCTLLSRGALCSELFRCPKLASVAWVDYCSLFLSVFPFFGVTGGMGSPQ